MFLGLINPELCCSEEAVALNLCKITKPRKQKLKVKILHGLKRNVEFQHLTSVFSV